MRKKIFIGILIVTILFNIFNISYNIIAEKLFNEDFDTYMEMLPESLTKNNINIGEGVFQNLSKEEINQFKKATIFITQKYNQERDIDDEMYTNPRGLETIFYNNIMNLSLNERLPDNPIDSVIIIIIDTILILRIIIYILERIIRKKSLF